MKPREAPKLMSRTIKYFYGTGFIDVIRWHFVDVQNAIYDKRPRSRNMRECCSGFLLLTLRVGKLKDTREYVSTCYGVCRK